MPAPMPLRRPTPVIRAARDIALGMSADELDIAMPPHLGVQLR